MWMAHIPEPDQSYVLFGHPCEFQMLLRTSLADLIGKQAPSLRFSDGLVKTLLTCRHVMDGARQCQCCPDPAGKPVPNGQRLLLLTGFAKPRIQSHCQGPGKGVGTQSDPWQYTVLQQTCISTSNCPKYLSCNLKPGQNYLLSSASFLILILDSHHSSKHNVSCFILKSNPEFYGTIYHAY